MPKPSGGCRPIVVLVCLLGASTFAGCGDDATEATSSDSATSTIVTINTDPAKTTKAPPKQISFTAKVVDGAVQGGVQRWQATVGESITIVVTNDAEDELHVHGYDVKAATAPGTPARVALNLDTPGVFEVELETGKTLVAQLVVKP